jgi:hypothetical protein
VSPPRYRGYGFRNVGGWEVRDNCAKAGRNLNIVSSSVMLYVFSGADVKSLSFGGASFDMSHPAVFLYFGLVAFVWLGYRFLLAYRDAADVDPWWHLYMRDIVLVRHPITAYVSAELHRRFAPAGRSFSMSFNPVVKDFGLIHGTLVVPEVSLDQEVVARRAEVELPLSQILRAHMYCLPRYLISNTDIADMWIPWLLYFLAALTIVATVCGADLAGLFGLIPARSM